jgi:transposase-like protein
MKTGRFPEELPKNSRRNSEAIWKQYRRTPKGLPKDRFCLVLKKRYFEPFRGVLRAFLPDYQAFYQIQVKNGLFSPLIPLKQPRGAVFAGYNRPCILECINEYPY